MKVIVHDPFVTPEQIEKAGFEAVSLESYIKEQTISPCMFLN